MALPSYAELVTGRTAAALFGDLVSLLKGKGLPQLGSSRRRGDHRFIFNVIIPANLSEQQQKLAADLDGTLTDENREPKESGIFSRMRRAFG